MNGLLGLTDKELAVTTVLLDLRDRPDHALYPNNIVCKPNREIIMKRLGISNQNVIQLISRLKAKHILVRGNRDDEFMLNKAIIPIIIGNRIVQITLLLKLNESEEV